MCMAVVAVQINTHNKELLEASGFIYLFWTIPACGWEGCPFALLAEGDHFSVVLSHLWIYFDFGIWDVCCAIFLCYGLFFDAYASPFLPIDIFIQYRLLYPCLHFAIFGFLTD